MNTRKFLILSVVLALAAIIVLALIPESPLTWPLIAVCGGCVIMDIIMLIEWKE